MLGLQACVTTFSKLLVNSKIIKANRSQTHKEKEKTLVSLKELSFLSYKYLCAEETLMCIFWCLPFKIDNVLSTYSFSNSAQSHYSVFSEDCFISVFYTKQATQSQIYGKDRSE